jgi:hypothetical protein
VIRGGTLVAQVLLYGGTFIVIAVSVWLPPPLKAHLKANPLLPA